MTDDLRAKRQKALDARLDTRITGPARAALIGIYGPSYLGADEGLDPDERFAATIRQISAHDEHRAYLQITPSVDEVWDHIQKTTPNTPADRINAWRHVQSASDEERAKMGPPSYAHSNLIAAKQASTSIVKESDSQNPARRDVGVTPDMAARFLVERGEKRIGRALTTSEMASMRAEANAMSPAERHALIPPEHRGQYVLTKEKPHPGDAVRLAELEMQSWDKLTPGEKITLDRLRRTQNTQGA